MAKDNPPTALFWSGTFFWTLALLFVIIGGNVFGAAGILALTAGSGLMLRGTEAHLQKAKQPKALLVNANPIKTEFDCAKYEERSLELKLAEAGIMEAEDVATCDDSHCPYCAPTRATRRVRQALKSRYDIEPRRNKFNSDHFGYQTYKDEWEEINYSGYYIKKRR